MTYYDPVDTVKLIYVSQYGCDSTITLKFTRPQLDTTVVVSQTQLQANPGNATIQWYTCDSLIQAIPNADSAIFTPTTNGKYMAILFEGDCVDTTRCIDFVNDISIEELTDPLFLKVYPNPTSDQLHISWPVGFAPIALKVYSSEGELVRMIPLNPNLTNFSLFLAHQPKGGYFVTLENQEGLSLEALVIKD